MAARKPAPPPPTSRTSCEEISSITAAARIIHSLEGGFKRSPCFVARAVRKGGMARRQTPRTGAGGLVRGVDFRIPCKYNVAEIEGLNAERKVSYENAARQEIHDSV